MILHAVIDYAVTGTENYIHSLNSLFVPVCLCVGERTLMKR